MGTICNFVIICDLYDLQDVSDPLTICGSKGFSVVGNNLANLFMLYPLLNLMTTWLGLLGQGVGIGRPQTFWKGNWFGGCGKSVFRQIISEVRAGYGE